MKYCGNCGKQVKDDARFCTSDRKRKQGNPALYIGYDQYIWSISKDRLRISGRFIGTER